MLPTITDRKIVDIRRKRAREKDLVRHGSENGHCSNERPRRKQRGIPKTPEGTAALAANFTVTGGIQTGAISQPTLLPFTEQQQALRDAFITDANFSQLADGLGTTLDAAYVARAHAVDRSHWTNLSPAVANLIAYADATTSANSTSGKYFFGNGTTNGTVPASTEAMAILKEMGGHTDIFGTSYGLPAGN
jgi:hypothetical protein